MKFSCVSLLAAALSAGVAHGLEGYGPLPTEEGLAVGDEICVYGFIMDNWCIVDVSSDCVVQ